MTQQVIDRIYYDTDGTITNRVYIQGDINLPAGDNWIDGTGIESIRYKRVDLNTHTLVDLDNRAELELAAEQSKIRQQRNMLLADSDWTELPSRQATNTAQWAQAWSTYRQALRDLDISDPANVVWPQKPTV